jgi:glutamate carboxypeptidase
MSRDVLRVNDLTSDAEETLAVVAELVDEDTPSDDKAANDRLLRRVEELMIEAGASTSIDEMANVGNVLRAEWSGPESDLVGPQVLMLGHLDTVWPSGEVATRQFRVADGRATGPGILDMKAGLVILAHGMRALKRRGLLPRRRIVALVNCDEEIGSVATREAIEREARRSGAVLVLEPAMPNGSLKTARKGSGRFHLRCRGRAAHAGAFPELGVSAIEELARQTSYLHGLTDFALGTTVNVGVIRGGTRPNVIAAEAEGDIDVRALTVSEMDRLERELRSLRPSLDGASLDIEGGWERPPMERTAGNGALFERAQAVARDLGIEVGEGSSGAASDGNFSTAMGIPTLDGLGAVGEGPHAANEFIEVGSLVERAALLGALVASLDEWGPDATDG